MSTANLTRKPVTILLAMATYLVAIGAAKLTGANIGAVNVGVEGVSAGAGSAPGGLGAVLPLGYAFAAGMVAAVNPCGFVLLPAYVALYLGRGELIGTSATRAERLVRAASLGLTMTAGR